MTREEAIGNLIHAIRWNDIPKKEAVDMAIKALKQQPCEDCISRQAAVDTINALHEKPNAWLDLAVDAVMILPSAIPQQKIGQWIKSQDCYGNDHFTCPFCGNDIATKYAGIWNDNYCSNCVAKLKSKK